MKKRQAIKVAAPFTAAIVAVAESWLYCNGVLCHIQDRMLRVLDLHRSATEEIVVDIRSLLDEAVPESRGNRKDRFQLLHYSQGIVSCLYTRFRPDVESWLVVFDIHQRKIVPLSSRSLESTNKIFVRNDQNYLYCGTHSEFGEDGFRRWVLIGYDLKAERWFNHKIHLLDMVGSDIGQSISFDIIDGYFYGLSNQTRFEFDEVDWTSYYHCFKFPVDKPEAKHIEKSTEDRMWRRQHAEGPIDDRWSFLRLLKNEEDGRLQILESRREWLDRRSSAQRTYYTTDLHFSPKSEGVSEEVGGDNGNSRRHDAEASTRILNPSAGDTIPPPQFHTNWALPDSPEPGRLRDPYNTHTGDDASTALPFTLSKCFIRSYYASSQAFVDLVDNPDPSDPERPRLQLRAGSRELRPSTQVPQYSPAYNVRIPHTERINHLYKQNGANNIVFWPPVCHEASEVRADSRALDQLNKIVNPPSHVGSVKGTWDDRSFLYSGTNAEGVQALVFLSFDPGVRLQGLQTWGQEQQSADTSGEKPSPRTDVSESEACATDEFGASPVGIMGEGGSGKGKTRQCSNEPINSPTTSATFSEQDSQQTLDWSTSDEETICSISKTAHPEPRHGLIGVQTTGLECNWAWREPAMYRQINVGFNDLPDFTSRRQTAACKCQ